MVSSLEISRPSIEILRYNRHKVLSQLSGISLIASDHDLGFHTMLQPCNDCHGACWFCQAHEPRVMLINGKNIKAELNPGDSFPYNDLEEMMQIYREFPNKNLGIWGSTDPLEWRDGDRNILDVLRLATRNGISPVITTSIPPGTELVKKQILDSEYAGSMLVSNVGRKTWGEKELDYYARSTPKDVDNIHFPIKGYDSHGDLLGLYPLLSVSPSYLISTGGMFARFPSVNCEYNPGGVMWVPYEVFESAGLFPYQNYDHRTIPKFCNISTGKDEDCNTVISRLKEEDNPLAEWLDFTVLSNSLNQYRMFSQVREIHRGIIESIYAERGDEQVHYAWDFNQDELVRMRDMWEESKIDGVNPAYLDPLINHPFLAQDDNTKQALNDLKAAMERGRN